MKLCVQCLFLVNQVGEAVAAGTNNNQNFVKIWKVVMLYMMKQFESLHALNCALHVNSNSGHFVS